MADSRHNSTPADLRVIDDAAAGWVARRDRGLTAAEQDEFFQWLAADPRHGERLARHQRGWSELAQLAQWRPEHGAEPNADLLAAPRARRRAGAVRWLGPLTLAAAAAGVFVFLRQPAPPAPAAIAAGEPNYRQETLADGTLVELNRGARFTVAFTAEERRVRLTHGEALFNVARMPARPFVVEVAGVHVRALGTAFNVRLGAAEVEVLVTEGQVRVERPAAPLPAPPVVSAGQRAIVPLADSPPQTTAVSAEEVERALSWQPRMLEFASTPLAEVAATFNRHNHVQLVVEGEALRALPIGASFRSDNVDGFVRSLEVSFGVQAERAGSTITLRRER